MRQVGSIDGLARGAKLGPRVVGQRRPRPAMQSILQPAAAPTLDGIIRQPLVAAATTATPTSGLNLSLPQIHVRRAYWQLPLAVIMTAALMVTGWSLTQRTQPTTSPVAATPAAAATPSPSATPIAELSAQLSQFATNTGVPTGIAVIDLKNGQTYGAGADQVFISASLYKLFVAEAVYTAMDSGTLHAGSTVPGTGRTVTECLRLMITVSDNPCGSALGSLIGWEKQNNRWHAQGFTNTNLFRSKDEKTSAGDVALLLKRLHEGTLLSPTSTEAFTKLLKDQKINNRLPQGLPVDSIVAHKTGDLNGLVHDAGIVYGPNGDYVISMMTGPWKNPGAAPAKFAELAGQVDALMRTAR